jgi:hypothetical protein
MQSGVRSALTTPGSGTGIGKKWKTENRDEGRRAKLF